MPRCAALPTHRAYSERLCTRPVDSQPARTPSGRASPRTCASSLETATAAVENAVGLKEWACTNAALAAGDQTIVLRKGGIREPRFKLRSPWFLLFDTDFHSDEALFKPAARRKYAKELLADVKAADPVQLGTLAQVTGAWMATDPAALHELDAFHIWSEQYVRGRAEWRANVPATIIELRCWRLAAAVALPNEPELWGCFSWVEPRGLSLDDLLRREREPALSDAAFAERQAGLREAIGRHAFDALPVPD